MSGHRHGCDGDHNHDETPEMGLQYSLYSKIDIGNLECLNEKVEGSGKSVFKAWENRLDFEKVCLPLNYVFLLHWETIIFRSMWCIQIIIKHAIRNITSFSIL